MAVLSWAVASKQPSTICEGKQGYQRGDTACPVLCISSGCQLHPAWSKEDILARAMQLLRFSAGHVMAEIWCSYICGDLGWEGWGGCRVEAAAFAGHLFPPVL